MDQKVPAAPLPKSRAFDIFEGGQCPFAVHVLDPDDLPTRFLTDPYDADRSAALSLVDPQLPLLANDEGVFDDESGSASTDIQRPANDLVSRVAQRYSVRRFFARPTRKSALCVHARSRWRERCS